MEDKGEKSSWGFNGFSDVNGFDAASSFVDSEWASTFDEKESKKTITTSSQREEEEEEEDFVDSSKLTLDPVDPRLTTSHVVKTGEENEEILFEARSRVSRFVPKDVYGDEERTNRWVSRGKGQ
ncbi:MAG: hypothetical protein VXV85_07730, partial [Candidatus Thermoplasmatota archaeon]|nr:hypothetical protein [Candidatus Thermoplasmatota archaeon]